MSTYDGTGPLPPCPCGGWWQVERWDSDGPRYRCAICRGPIPIGWLAKYKRWLEARDGAEHVEAHYPALKYVPRISD